MSETVFRAPRIALDDEAPRAEAPVPEAPARPPRVVVEETAGPARLDHGWDEASAIPVLPPAPRSALTLLALGVLVLILGFSALAAGTTVADLFQRSALLGWFGLAVAAGGFGLILAAGWREVSALAGLRTVDAARRAFARGDHTAARAETLAWAARIPAAAPHLAALRAAPDVATLRALLDAGPLRTLEGESRALGRAAAVQGFAATAISPAPAWDALVIAWRGLRLVRQVAALHGMRPGIAATLSLLRRAAFDAATVAGTEIVTDAAVRAVVTNPLVAHVAGEAAAGAVAARRLITLARATASACRILPTA